MSTLTAYYDKVLVRKIETPKDPLLDNFIEGEILSIGYNGVLSENDPLEVGDIVLIEPGALGFSVQDGDETLYLYRKHQILIIK